MADAPPAPPPDDGPDNQGGAALVPRADAVPVAQVDVVTVHYTLQENVVGAPTTFGAAAELHGACDHLYKDGDKTIVGEGKDKREDIYDAVASDLTTHPVRWLNTMKIHQNANSLFDRTRLHTRHKCA
jgi:hypothetical protein